VFSADLSAEALAGRGGVRRDDFAPASQVLTLLALLVVACSVAALLQLCCSERDDFVLLRHSAQYGARLEEEEEEEDWAFSQQRINGSRGGQRRHSPA
jgi:hypothetical protein